MNNYRNQPPGGRPSHRPQPHDNRARDKQMPAPNTVTYYHGGRLRADLLDQEAEEIAKRLRQVTTTQLRRFYEDVLNLKQRLKLLGGNEAAFEELRAEFKMLKAKAVYANGRNDKTFPQELLQFFLDHVHSVNTAADFDAFCKHFQAVVAFHKFYGKD